MKKPMKFTRQRCVEYLVLRLLRLAFWAVRDLPPANQCVHWRFTEEGKNSKQGMEYNIDVIVLQQRYTAEPEENSNDTVG